MVRGTIFGGMMLPAALLLLPALPGRADSVLEQMQNEVASLAKHTKSAVVSIEDERALTLRFSTGSAENRKTLFLETQTADTTREPQTKELEKQVFLLSAELEENEKELPHLREMYTDENPQVKQAKAKRDSLRKRLEESRQQLKDLQTANPPQTYLLTTPPKSGSGFSIGDGYIVTTADVLDGMGSPLVVTDSGTRIKARVVGVNANLNIGLLQLLGKSDIPALELGDSGTVTVGHFAVSVGNQSGQANSVALMLVGGIRSEGTYSGNHFYPRLIQFAGTVGAGTSGAPLVNVRGEVIGMMAAVPASLSLWRTSAADQSTMGQYYKQLYKNQTGGQKQGTEPKTEGGTLFYQNKVPMLGNLPVMGQLFRTQRFWEPSPVTSAGFAIPINDIKPVIEELRKGTPLVQGWIGISPKEEERVNEQDGIINVDKTVTIEGIFPDSPAFRAGLQPGDVILSLNGKPVQSAADVREVSVGLRPGDKLTVAVRRAGETHSYELTIAARPAVIKPPITTPIKESL